MCVIASDATSSDCVRSLRDERAISGLRFLRNVGEMSASNSNREWYGPGRTPLGKIARGEGSNVEFVVLEIQNPLIAPVIVNCSLSRVWTVT